MSYTWSLCPGETPDPCGQREMSRFPWKSCHPGQESLRKFRSLAIISLGITVAPAMPCEMPVDAEAAASGRAESPPDAQTAQQLSNAPATWASPHVSAFQKKKRQVTSVDIYSPTQHDGRRRKMLA